MSSSSSRIAVRASAAMRAGQPADALAAEFTALYARSQKNEYVFGSPLGPLSPQGRPAYLPRFVFFGPQATDDSWRLAFLAGFDRRDVRASQAVLRLIASLADRAEDAHGLNLTFFPVVDVAPLSAPAAPRELERAHWARATAPEIDLLEKDARLRGYHGFIRVESDGDDQEVGTVRVREPANVLASPDVELISSEETDPFPIRFERAARSVPIVDGPLTIADDLPVQPFELTLRLPAAWPNEIYFQAAGSILTRFLLRYRAFQAYGQHL